MKMILTGGGDSDHFREMDDHFISLLGPNPRLLFIPLAGDHDTWDRGRQRVRQTFETVQFQSIDMCLDLSELEWEDLQRADAMYLDGGNTFQLMESIRETHFYELLHRFLFQGGVVNGDSAGAIVLGSHLETAHFGDEGDDNDTDVISYQGLNLLGSWAIHCHYKPDEDQEIQEFVTQYGFPVIALAESCGVYIDDYQLWCIGETPAKIFHPRGQRIIPPQQNLRLDLFMR